MGKLDNQVVIVTGAGRGWGQAIAVKTAREGANTIVVARTQSEIDNTVNMINAEGNRAEGYSVDVSNDTEVLKMLDGVMSKYGRLDVMINNAAILPLKTFESATMEEIDRVLAINLRAYLFICKQVIEVMKKQGGGSIINVSSNSGIDGYENESVYCTAKHGIEGFTKSVAIELAPLNIAVNTITPGSLEHRIKATSITQKMWDAMTDEERAVYTDPIEYTEAFVYLGLQRPANGGISGKRISAYKLSEHIRKAGYNLTLADLKQESPLLGWF